MIRTNPSQRKSSPRRFFLMALAATAIFLFPASAFPEMSAATPRPTPTPLEILVQMRDEDGNEVTRRVQLRGNLPGDIQEFVREQNLLRMTPTPVPTASLTPMPPKTDAVRPPSSLLDASSTHTLADDVPEAAQLFKHAQERLRRGDYSGGNEILRQILAQWPTSRSAGEAHVALGRQAEYQGNYDVAIEHLQHPTLQGLPPQRRVMARLALARSLINRDRYREASEAVARIEHLTLDHQHRTEAQGILQRLQVLGSASPPIHVREILSNNDINIHDTSDFNITPLDGGGQRIVPPAGQVVWINFIEITCPHSEKVYPQQAAQMEIARANGVLGIWISSTLRSSVSHSRQEFEHYLSKHPLPGLVAEDWNFRETFRAFSGRGTPWTVLIDRTGIVRYADIYQRDRVEARLRDLLGEAPPEANRIGEQR